MKNLLNMTLLVGGLLGSSAGIHAEALRVRVPFAFTASGTKLPAGEYSITEIAGSPTVLLIRGDGARALVFARASGVASDGGLPVTFEEGSAGMTLVSVRTAGSAFELSNPVSRTNLAANPTKTASLSIK